MTVVEDDGMVFWMLGECRSCSSIGLAGIKSSPVATSVFLTILMSIVSLKMSILDAKVAKASACLLRFMLKLDLGERSD